LSVGVGEVAEQYNDMMRKVAKEVNDESDSTSYGVVFQPGLTEFKDGSSPYGQGYMSGLDW
jgi:hypothetical protein